MYTVFLNSITDLFDQPDSTQRVDQALCGMTAQVLEVRGTWMYLETCYGYRGWVQRNRMRPLTKRTPWDTAPKRLVQQAMADVLTRPQVQSTRLTFLVRGCIVGQLGTAPENGWMHICLPEGEAGWIPASFLKPFPSFTGLPEPELRQQIVRSARTYLGTQYRWGGKSPFGIDCSGLVQMAYLLNGIVIWRDAEMKDGYPVHPITQEELQPADLLFFPGHVALYLGHKHFLHATGHVGDHCVTINSLNPASPLFRKDLADTIQAVGSAFPLNPSSAFSIV